MMLLLHWLQNWTPCNWFWQCVHCSREWGDVSNELTLIAEEQLRGWKQWTSLHHSACALLSWNGHAMHCQCMLKVGHNVISHVSSFLLFLNRVSSVFCLAQSQRTHACSLKLDYGHTGPAFQRRGGCKPATRVLWLGLSCLQGTCTQWWSLVDSARTGRWTTVQTAAALTRQCFYGDCPGIVAALALSLQGALAETSGVERTMKVMRQ